MASTYRLDIRYLPVAGINALKRIERLSQRLVEDGFGVSDISVYDDGMRVSLLVEPRSDGSIELQLLSAASETGSIGRFSCREATLEEITSTIEEDSTTATV